MSTDTTVPTAAEIAATAVTGVIVTTPASTTTVMGVDEAQRQHERIVKAKGKFLRIGEELGALLYEMNVRRGYKALGHPTFAEYCNKDLGISRQRAYQLISTERIKAIATAQGVSEDTVKAIREADRQTLGESTVRQMLMDGATADVVRQAAEAKRTERATKANVTVDIVDQDQKATRYVASLTAAVKVIDETDGVVRQRFYGKVGTELLGSLVQLTKALLDNSPHDTVEMANELTASLVKAAKAAGSSKASSAA